MRTAESVALSSARVDDGAIDGEPHDIGNEQHEDERYEIARYSTLVIGFTLFSDGDEDPAQKEDGHEEVAPLMKKGKRGRTRSGTETGEKQGDSEEDDKGAEEKSDVRDKLADDAQNDQENAGNDLKYGACFSIAGIEIRHVFI